MLLMELKMCMIQYNKGLKLMQAGGSLSRKGQASFAVRWILLRAVKEDKNKVYDFIYCDNYCNSMYMDFCMITVRRQHI